MLKSLARIAAWLAAPSDPTDIEADPLSHPLLARMTARELADLPLPAPVRRPVRDCGCTA